MAGLAAEEYLVQVTSRCKRAQSGADQANISTDSVILMLFNSVLPCGECRNDQTDDDPD